MGIRSRSSMNQGGNIYRTSAGLPGAMRPATMENERVRKSRLDSMPVAHFAHAYHGNPQGCTRARADGYSVHCAVELPQAPEQEYLKNGPAYARYGYGYPYDPNCFTPSTHTYGALTDNRGAVYGPCHKGMYPQARTSAHQPLANHSGMDCTSRFHGPAFDCRKPAGGWRTPTGGGFNLY